ncbi:MAG TPA: XisH family protein [Blastocatellia bacterium]|nr:XisH family protein [Blastocatellia bacterium]
MPQRDRHHDSLKNALTNDGWTVTDDPLSLKVGQTNLFVDLGAEKLLLAEKKDRKIGVELKTFGGASEVRELELSFGQYFVYQAVLEKNQPERVLYLAVTQVIYEDIFTDDLGKLLLETYNPNLIIFDADKEVILQWRP